MNEECRKANVGLWATIIIVAVLVGYPLSLGPACWWLAMTLPANQPTAVAPRVYWPIGWLAANGPSPFRDGIFWYATRGWRKSVAMPLNWDGTSRFTASGPSSLFSR